MSETKKRENPKHENSVRANGFSIDLLQRFISKNKSPLKLEGTGKKYEEKDEEEEDVELSLGLSLNGRFGVDPKRAKKLARSSSISDFMTTDNNDNIGGNSPLEAYTPLVRTCSLPTGTEEWRKRKELQSLRRLAAKRKRLEKLKNVRTIRDQEENSEENGQLHCQKGPVAINGYGEFCHPPFGVPNWVSATARGGAANGQGTELKGERTASPSRQGSIGSQGSGSSGISESGSLPGKGINRPNEARSPANKIQPPPRQNEQENGKLDKTDITARENGSVKSAVENNKAKEMLRNVLLDMPYVSTTGVGPDGKRIEGFLYRYRKGEEARIVCVCHGSFLSPAEFVKHAGGGDVAHPLKHIIVNPSPLV